MTPSLYASLLGAAWSRLAPAVRWVHAGAGADGRFRVRRGTNVLARWVGATLGMPREGENVEVALAVQRTDDGERWTRAFAGKPLVTFQFSTGGLLVETMGPVHCVFRLRVEDRSLVFEQVAARVGFRRLAVPLPRFLSPSIVGRADPENDDVRVDVRIHAPVLGLLVSYDGVVTPRPVRETPP